MSYITLIISLAAFIASCNASIGHIVPAVRTAPIVRYAPFYNFPNGVRSIHAVSAPVAVAPAPVLPAPDVVRTPLLSFPAPVIPAPIHAPIFRSPAPFFSAPTSAIPAPAPLFPAPVPGFPAPVPAFPAPVPAYPAPVPAFPSPAPIPSPLFPIPAPAFTVPAPFYSRIAPVVSGSAIARAVPTLPAATFSPILRPVAAPVSAPLFAGAVGPAPTAVTRVVPINISPYASGPLAHASIVKQLAWK